MYLFSVVEMVTSLGVFQCSNANDDVGVYYLQIIHHYLS
jgi:hypothetical protein